MEGHDSELSVRDYPTTGTDGAAPTADSSARYARRVEDEPDMQVGETRHRSTSISATVTSIRARPDGSRPALTREEALAADLDPAVDPDRADSTDRTSSGDILGLLREYRAAETTSRREARRETAMGETDLLAMRLLVDAHADGRLLTPGAIATALGISTASTTALIDRLSSADFAERRPHETDRRSTVIVPTVRSEREVREALGRGQASIARVADAMSQDEIDVVARFLTNLISAVRDEPDAR